MREVLLLAIHSLVTLAKLSRRGGVRAVIAESLFLKHQLLITARSRRRGAGHLGQKRSSLHCIDRVFISSLDVVIGRE